MGEYFESFPEEITKWEIIRGMVDLDLDDAQPLHSKEIPSVQLLPRQDVIRYGCIPKMEQVVYTKCKECKLVFNPRDILSHKSCSGKSITATPHSSKKKVKNKGSSSKRPSSNLRRRPLFKETASPPNSNAPVPVSISSASSSSSASAQPAVEMVVEKVTSSPVVKTTTTTTATSSTKSELTVSTSGSSKGHSTHSQKSHHPSWPSRTEIAGSTSVSSSSHGHHHGHGHGHHHHHHHHSSSHSNHGHSSNSSSSSSSRHKKSRKSNSSCRVAVKEFDPDIHCGVVESGKGPCTRSVTCSNHRIQLRKLVPGRSKDILQLIAEKKTSKEQAPSPNGGLPEEKDSFSQSTTCVPLAEVNASTNEPDKSKAALTPATLPKANDISSYPRQTTLYSSDKNGNTTDMENKSLKDANVTVNVKEEDTNGAIPIDYLPMSPMSVVAPVQNGNTTDMENKSLKDANVTVNVKEEDTNGAIPIGYMPMSPISVVAPVQDWKIDKKDYYVCLLKCFKSVPGSNHHHHSMVDVKTEDDVKVPIATTASVLVPIVNSSVKLYRSHPKPVAIPTYSTKKIGGAILISNPHVDSQRQEILMAINKHKMINNTHGFRLNNHTNHINHVNNHRPNILKVRGVNKVNYKRLATEKLNTGENKHVRLTPNVNGFILHSDISESAEAPQSNNNCLQQALLNMK